MAQHLNGSSQGDWVTDGDDLRNSDGFCDGLPASSSTYTASGGANTKPFNPNGIGYRRFPDAIDLTQNTTSPKRSNQEFDKPDSRKRSKTSETRNEDSAIITESLSYAHNHFNPFQNAAADIQINEGFPHQNTPSLMNGLGSTSSTPIHSTPIQDYTEFRQSSASHTNAKLVPIVNRISCIEADPSVFHACLMYRDPLMWGVVNGQLSNHLVAAEPVPDMEDFLASLGNPGYIVFRDHLCGKEQKNLQNEEISPALEPPRKVLTYDESMAIISRDLQTAIAATATYSPPIDSWRFQAPYHFIYHHRDKLSELGKSSPAPLEHQICSMLLHVRLAYGYIYKQTGALIAEGKISRYCIPVYFQPNKIIVIKRATSSIAFVLKAVPEWSLHNNCFNLDCWGWQFNGRHLERRPCILQTGCFPSETIPLPDLGVYMMQALDGTTVRKDLQKRGEAIWRLILNQRQVLIYNGCDVRGEKNYANSKCIIDYETLKKYHPGAPTFCSSTSPKLSFDRRAETRCLEEDLTDDDFILLAPDIQAFMLKEKEWATLHGDQVQKTEWQKHSFESLALLNNMKDIVKSLVMIRSSSNRKVNELRLSGKWTCLSSTTTGRRDGLIILLYGGPGTGKTLIAESIAEIAELPLYSIGSGKIETSAQGAEKILQNVLYFGRTWNCVLLLENADFMLKEDTSDLESNLIVSVYRRLFREYEGIIILTSTNPHPGTFNDAFKTTTHLAIHCPKLDQSSRKKIWLNSFTSLHKTDELGDADRDGLESRVDELAEREMNGWQIRNALMVARQVALCKGEGLGWSHLLLAVGVVGDC